MSKKKIEYVELSIPSHFSECFVENKIYHIRKIVEHSKDIYCKVQDIDEKYITLFNKEKGIFKYEYPKDYSKIHYYGEKREKRTRILNVLLIISLLTFNPVLIIFFIIIIAANSFFSDSDN